MIDTYLDYQLDCLPQAAVPDIGPLARRAAADGAVLLKNNGALPLKRDERIALLGRAQFDTLYTGLGSGGSVNKCYSISYIDGLRAGGADIYEPLADMYEDWLDHNPFNEGNGWGEWPISQSEMPIEDEVYAAAAAECSTAVIIFSRRCGEDRDNILAEGGYYLTADERLIIKKAASAFDKVVLVLNTGAVIDTSYADGDEIDALLYHFYSGMESGSALCDLLYGDVCPSGKLTDTALYRITDCPASLAVTDRQIFYNEDIYVGYRYFETVNKDAVQYPFGFGLSYTDFELKVGAAGFVGSKVSISAEVTNIGSCAGRQTVQVYLSAPQGKLGRPLRELAAFAKTGLLEPGQSELLDIEFRLDDFAAFDDSGSTGHPYSYVLEAGEYRVYVGTDVRSARCAIAYNIDRLRVVSTVGSAMAPVTPFSRLRPVLGNTVTMVEESVPLADYDVESRISERRPAAWPITTDKGITLFDVADGNAGMQDFIAQISDRQLMCMVRGEGMCSPKVTAGTAAAFGGTTEELLRRGVPILCCADGPSGIRMDGGAEASLIPCGTALAATWDTELVEDIYALIGVEMRAYKVDALLGPAMNIHRHALCGRNFEYYSEDPLVSGAMGTAALRGLARCGVSGVIKHMSANNQELGRTCYDSVVSQRALREIYLRPFQIAVASGVQCSIMTSYNSVNRMWSAGNYDLCTAIIRDEWGYKGIVMSDWWAQMNYFGHQPSKSNLSCCVRAQNDVYMVTGAAANNADDLDSALLDGRITRAELQRCAANICRYAMTTPAFARFKASGGKIESMNDYDIESLPLVYCYENIEKGQELPVSIREKGKYLMVVTYCNGCSSVTQNQLTFMLDRSGAGSVTVSGTQGQSAVLSNVVYLDEGRKTVTVECADDTFEMMRFELRRID